MADRISEKTTLLLKEVVVWRLTQEALDTADGVIEHEEDERSAIAIVLFVVLLFGLIFREVRVLVMVAALIGIVVRVINVERRKARRKMARGKVRADIVVNLKKAKANLPLEFQFICEAETDPIIRVWQLTLADEIHPG